MLKVHRTRAGNKLLIAEMSDQHLVNTVKLNLAKIAKLQRGLVETPSINPYHARLYGMPKVDIDEAARKSRNVIEHMYPYLAELYLRGLTDLVEPLRKVVGRDGQLGESMGLLPEGEDELNGFDLNSFLDSFDIEETKIIESQFDSAVRNELKTVNNITGGLQ